MKILTFTIFLVALGCICCAENVKKSVDNLRSDNGEDNGDNDESKDVAMDIPDIEPSENKTQLCSARRQQHNMHPIMNATARQFPFVVAMMSLNEEQLCSGAVLSNGMILTTASCADKQINSVLFNTIRAKKDFKDAERISVIRSEKFPSYNGEESLNNVAIIYTHKHNASIASKIKISNYTSAQNLVDVELFGYGLNEAADKSKDLQYVGVENRFQSQPGNLLHLYIDCVDTKEPTCFRDYGGPAIFGNELIGIIVKGNDECVDEMSANYAINKEMATVLPTYSFKHWLNEKIKKYEEQNAESIATYPSKLVGKFSKSGETAFDSAATMPVDALKTFFIMLLGRMVSMYFD